MNISENVKCSIVVIIGTLSIIQFFRAMGKDDDEQFEASKNEETKGDTEKLPFLGQ